MRHPQFLLIIFRKIYFFTAFLLIIPASLLLENCAIRQSPPGGPEDKTPPEIIYTFPAPDSTNVTQLEYLEIHFDEDVDRSSVRNQLWMIPEPPNGFELDWKGGKKLRVLLNDSLNKNQTYIFTVGTGVKDYRGNTRNTPYMIPFSSGPVIDRGEISGNIVAEQTEGIFIYAYEISDTFSAEIVFKEKPPYYTQAGKEGRYQIKYLRPANYRVYALNDNNRDGIYTLEIDEIGIPFTDVLIDANIKQVKNINFSMVREDTTGPERQRAKAIYDNQLEITFDEPVAPRQQFIIDIQDSTTQAPLKVLSAEIDEKETAKLLVFTETQTKTGYIGKIDPLKDEFGNQSSPDGQMFRFGGSEKTDTVSAKLSATQPRNNQRNVRYGEKIQLEFSQPVDSLTLKNHFRIVDNDSLPVSGRWEFFSSLKPEFVPDTSFEKGQQYTFFLDQENIMSVYGQAIGDSISVHQFTAWDFADLGEVGGQVRTGNTEWRRAIIEAESYTNGEKYTVNVETNMPYLIEFLPEGRYKVSAAIDVNDNGRYDKGKSFPYEASEPFLIYTDSVKVRKRWTTEGINFYFQPGK